MNHAFCRISYGNILFATIWMYLRCLCTIHSFLMPKCVHHNDPFHNKLQKSIPFEMLKKNIGLDIVNNNNADSDSDIIRRKSQSKQSSDLSSNDNKQVRSRIRIRKTKESDLNVIATFLAQTTTTTEEDEQTMNPFQNWKQKIDKMWAKNDIEELLRNRNRVITQGNKSYESIQKRLSSEIVVNNNPLDVENNSNNGYTDQDFLKYFWYYSDSLRSMIDNASQMTGEDNIWLYHKDMILTPTSWNWLHHLQVTAYICDDNGKEVIVGFCEVAMLVNPAIDKPSSIRNGVVDRNNKGVVDEEDNNDNVVWMDDIRQTNQLVAFSPAITNLATSFQYRRCGIGTRLLQVVEKYCQMNWKTKQLGLYVEKTNQPAMSLYMNKLQYQSIYSCVATKRLGEMWYMSKDLNGIQKRDTKQKSINNNDQVDNTLSITNTSDDNNSRVESYDPMDFSTVTRTGGKDIEQFPIPAEQKETVAFNLKYNDESRNISLIDAEMKVPIVR